MSTSAAAALATVDFGASDKFGAHVFRVQIPAARSEPVVIVEDYGTVPDNGIQVIMFTHQSGSIWADMAGIVWASGLQVTAAWYVVTETDSALREGSYVKGSATTPATPACR